MIFFLYGEDDFRAKRKLKELKEKFLKEVDAAGSSFAWLDGEKTSLKEINEKAAAASLLARRRMIVIENLFRTKTKEILSEIKKYFQEKEAAGYDNIIIFLENQIKSKLKFNSLEIVKWSAEGRDYPLNKAEKDLFDFLAGQKFSQEFKKLNSGEMLAWIKNEAAARGGEFSPRAAAELSALANGEMWQIDREISKLINYQQGKNPQLAAGGKVLITEKEVQDLVQGNFAENIFALTDAIGARQKGIALKFLEEEINSGANEIYLLTMIIRQVKIILQVRQALDAGKNPRQIAADLKMNSFVAGKAAAQAKNFTLAGLKNLLDELIKIDYQVKTGRGEALTLLNLFISRL